LRAFYALSVSVWGTCMGTLNPTAVPVGEHCMNFTYGPITSTDTDGHPIPERWARESLLQAAFQRGGPLEQGATPHSITVRAAPAA
jgi:hypothetical protein